MSDSYVHDYELHSKYNSLKDQNNQRIQEEFDLLTNATNEQVASWRRELEQRLLTDDKTEKSEVNNGMNGLESDEDEITNRKANIIDINNNVKPS